MRLFNRIGLLGRSALCLVFVAGTTAFTPTEADAASFFIDLCDVNAAECAGDNLTEASLTFDEILSGTDHNDYTLTMKVTGTGTDTIDQVQFTLGGVKTPEGYETIPTVVGPAGTDPWSVFYDNVSNATSCQEDGGSQGVCANQSDFSLGGPPVNGTHTWVWQVNLADTLGVLGVGSSANFRIHFLTFDGKPGGNLSPGGGLLTTTTEVTTTTDVTTEVTTVITTETDLPEPTLLTLLGAGLAGVSLRLRRRKA